MVPSSYAPIGYAGARLRSPLGCQLGKKWVIARSALAYSQPLTLDFFPFILRVSRKSGLTSLT